jgi:hypothetical protein
MPLSESCNRKIKLVDHFRGTPNADSARWAGVSIAAMSVRRLSGSAWAALSGRGIHRGAAGNMAAKLCIAESGCGCVSRRLRCAALERLVT